VTCMAWGRATIGGGSTEGANGDVTGKGGTGDTGVKKVNVLATGSVDLSVKVSVWSGNRIDADID